MGDVRFHEQQLNAVNLNTARVSKCYCEAQATHCAVVDDAVGIELRDKWRAPGAACSRHPRAPRLRQLNRHLTHSARSAEHQDARVGANGCAIEA